MAGARDRSRSRENDASQVPQIRVANAPCSWGRLEFDGDKLGGGMAAGYEQVLDEIAESGYVGTELGDWGFMPTNPTELAADLKKRGLGMVAAFVPVALAQKEAHAAGIETCVRTARLLAAVAEKPFIVLADENGSVPARTKNAGRIKPEHGLDDAGWKTYAEGANAVAHAVFAETGVRTVFHHHCGGWIETPSEIDRLLEMTDPKVLGLVLDAGHIAYGGGDPVDTFKRHGDRVWHVHFKDHHPEVARKAREGDWDYFRAVGEGIFCELGAGDVDFAGLIKAMRARDYSGWVVVEQDILPGMGDPLASAKKNRDFIRTLGL